eukprot:746806-Hanusia_phi.AAC.3
MICSIYNHSASVGDKTIDRGTHILQRVLNLRHQNVHGIPHLAHIDGLSHKHEDEQKDDVGGRGERGGGGGSLERLGSTDPAAIGVERLEDFAYLLHLLLRQLCPRLAPLHVCPLSNVRLSGDEGRTGGKPSNGHGSRGEGGRREEGGGRKGRRWEATTTRGGGLLGKKERRGEEVEEGRDQPRRKRGEGRKSHRDFDGCTGRWKALTFKLQDPNIMAQRRRTIAVVP